MFKNLTNHLANCRIYHIWTRIYCNLPARVLGKHHCYRFFGNSASNGALFCWFPLPNAIVRCRMADMFQSFCLPIHARSTCHFQRIWIHTCAKISAYTPSKSNMAVKNPPLIGLFPRKKPPPSVLSCVDRLHRPYQQLRQGWPWWQ